MLVQQRMTIVIEHILTPPTIAIRVCKLLLVSEGGTRKREEWDREGGHTFGLGSRAESLVVGRL